MIFMDTKLFMSFIQEKLYADVVGEDYLEMALA